MHIHIPINSNDMITGKRLAAVALASIVLTGCVTPEPPLYRWGAYEDIIYTGYADPGSSNPVADGELIAADLERNAVEGKAVPPGVRVHLGYLYYAQGRDSEARALFELEKEAFPSSAVFIDGFLSRMGAR